MQTYTYGHECTSRQCGAHSSSAQLTFSPCFMEHVNDGNNNVKGIVSDICTTAHAQKHDVWARSKSRAIEINLRIVRIQKLITLHREV